MSTAMFDDPIYTDDGTAPRSSDRGDRPTSLKPGTLVYLWPPNEDARTTRPVLARVKMTRQHAIEGVDLSDGGDRWYEVGTRSAIGTSIGWTWEEAAPPPGAPELCQGVQVIDAAPDPAERARQLAGEPGTKLKVSLSNGEVVNGVLTHLIMGQGSWEAEWGLLTDVIPGGDIAEHAVRIADVSKITRFRRA